MQQKGNYTKFIKCWFYYLFHYLQWVPTYFPSIADQIHLPVPIKLFWRKLIKSGFKSNPSPPPPCRPIRGEKSCFAFRQVSTLSNPHLRIWPTILYKKIVFQSSTPFWIFPSITFSVLPYKFQTPLLAP